MLLKGKDEVSKYIQEKGIKYFKPEEFQCRHCGEVIIDNFLIDTIEQLREYLQKPLIITSAYRCPVHNKRVGGIKNSPHIKGLALDILITNSVDRFKTVNFLLNKGIRRIGIRNDFIHFDIDKTKPQNVIWLYGKKRHKA